MAQRTLWRRAARSAKLVRFLICRGMPSAPALPVAPARVVNQRVVKIRRDYNAWVASESMEDYALRFTPRRFRKWTAMRVANTAFGASSFLVLEAVGGTLLVQHGFVNAFWAILATALVIVLAGWPISVYAARHGLDMDLLTRGAGFGYIGSTVTSLIYASFTFIFFALEAAIMAYALELAFDIPPAWGYLVCALVVIPLVTHGITTISRLQVWTQPVWLAMLALPFGFVLVKEPGAITSLWHYGGANGVQGFDLLQFGAATTVGIALITQMGEQADYLRFMPPPKEGQRWRWHAAVAIGGPGWVAPGVLKMLGGALLAFLAIGYAVPVERAVEPTQMYLVAYNLVFSHYGVAVAATAVFVIVSQLKINVTNAYAGSLAWSNFFARLTHAHPGRVVWMVFNIAIALMLMELNVFQALGQVLGLYANLAISWMMAVVADLVINKPMGWSPKGIEFRRAYLYDVNPVGVGAMGVASVLSVAAYLGAMGPIAQAFSALIALVAATVVSPLLAWATKGRYYIARPAEADALGAKLAQTRCTICERSYEPEDMAACPAYGGAICSLCCSLDARCHDACKPEAARWSFQWRGAMRRLMPAAFWRRLDTALGHYLMLMGLAAAALAAVFALVRAHELQRTGPVLGTAEPVLAELLGGGFVKLYAVLLIAAAIIAWWIVLKHRSAQVAQEESNRQTLLLTQEIDSHRRTDEALKAAMQRAELAQRAADAANAAKTRYITTISHELRTPLNSILGYAQLLEDDASMPPQRRQAVSVIRRGGDHLLSLVEDTLDIARIENGRLALEPKPLRFGAVIDELVRIFEPQAQRKSIAFRCELQGRLPQAVRGDERRLRQILLNVIGNAVKFTAAGSVTLRVTHLRDMARFDIIDTGPGMDEAELARVFEPFERGSAEGGGSGLGLTIARMLTDLMGGEMTVHSAPGQGSRFGIRLFLPEIDAAALPEPAGLRPTRSGYRGPRRTLLVVDNEEADRGFVAHALQPLGFEVVQAGSGEQCLALLDQGLQPDVILMDLAMPGIDGWATLRAVHKQPLALPATAIISANGFDKGLDNDVGVTAQDFFVKPLRLPDLLDWIGRRLALEWTVTAPAPSAPVTAIWEASAMPASAAPPAAASAGDHLRDIDQIVATGYLRGILARIAQAEAEAPSASPLYAVLRQHAQGFRFDAMRTVLRKALLDEQHLAR
jgi:signal transduction histidine kinase/ActR/RegA family two-component response regulator